MQHSPCGVFVKVFSNKDVAIPFLKAILKVDVEYVQIVGESHLQSNPQKKYVRFRRDGQGKCR